MSQAITIVSVLSEAVARLHGISDTPRLDAELLLSQVLQQPRSYLFAWPERTLDPTQLMHWQTLLARRLGGEPIAYILGRREFWSLDLSVTPAVLIPRPETELLVELALAQMPSGAKPCIADLGTGSGAIALALASERRHARIIASDFSPQALAVARCNAQRLGVANIEFRQGDWCRALRAGSCDGIVTNPPYIAADDPHLQQGDPRFEPVTALVAGSDGLAAIRKIAQQAGFYLKPGAWLLLEHGFEQAPKVRQILRQNGFSAITSHCDLLGHERVTGAVAAIGN